MKTSDYISNHYTKRASFSSPLKERSSNSYFNQGSDINIKGQGRRIVVNRSSYGIETIAGKDMVYKGNKAFTLKEPHLVKQYIRDFGFRVVGTDPNKGTFDFTTVESEAGKRTIGLEYSKTKRTTLPKGYIDGGETKSINFNPKGQSSQDKISQEAKEFLNNPAKLHNQTNNLDFVKPGHNTQINEGDIMGAPRNKVKSPKNGTKVGSTKINANTIVNTPTPPVTPVQTNAPVNTLTPPAAPVQTNTPINKLGATKAVVDGVEEGVKQGVGNAVKGATKEVLSGGERKIFKTLSKYGAEGLPYLKKAAPYAVAAGVLAGGSYLLSNLAYNLNAGRQ